MKKRRLSILLVLALVLQMMPLPAGIWTGIFPLVSTSRAAEAPLSGKNEAGNISWSLTKVGSGYKLTLTGTGKMGDYSYKNYEERQGYPSDYRTSAPWGYYADEIQSVSVGEGITDISAYAFYECNDITTVEIPSTVTEIGRYSFYSCYELQNITLPSGLKSINDQAFRGCGSLKGLNLPQGLEKIGASAFQSTFTDAGVDTVNIPNTVTSIGGSAFSGANIKRITVPASVKTIASGTFQSCKKLTQAVICEGITSIGGSAFSGCGFLTDLTLPENSLSSIGAGAFNNTALQSITIPASVTSIGVNPFVGGTFRTINVAEGNSKFKTVNKMLVECKDSELYKVISYPCNGGEDADVPVQVQIIGDSAFASSGVKNVKVSGTVNVIEKSAFSQSELETIDLPGSLQEIRDSAFYMAQKLKAIDVPGRVTKIGQYCFYYCSSLKEVTLGGDLVSMGNSAFAYCTKITGIVLPDKLTSIGNSAFSHCTGLIEMTFPNSITKIGENVLEYCITLKRVSFGEKIQTIAGNVFLNCPKLAEIIVSPRNESMVAEDNVVYDKEKKKLIYFAAGIPEDKFLIPETVETIGSYAFTYCQHMAELRIPASVTLMEQRAVYHNDSITKLLFYGNAPVVSENGQSQYDYSSYPYKENGFIAYNSSVYQNKVKTGYDNDGLTIHYVEGTTGWSDGWRGTKTYKKQQEKWGNNFKWQQNCIFVDWDPSRVDVANGDFNNGLTWKYRDDIGELTFIGEGTVPDYTDTLPTWSNDPSINHMKDIKLIETGGAIRIGNNAFRGADHLVRILSEEKLEEVGDNTFSDCTSLKVVHIPSASVIGTETFMNDTALRNDLDLRGVRTMGDRAFKNCSSMTELLLGESLKTIGEEAFLSCASLEVMILPESTESIGQACFSDCRSLRSINIPKGVKAIPASCFAGASGLEKIYFYGDCPTWQESSFTDTNENLTIYYRKGNTTWENAGDEWAGIPVVGLDKFYTEQKDHYSFSNSEDSFGYGSLYYIPRQRYVTALQSVVRGSYYHEWDCGWRGSCFGMAASTTEFYEGDNFSVKDYDSSAENLFDLSAPGSPDADLTKIIEIYQVSQFTDAVGAETERNYGEYRQLIRQVEEFERSGGLDVDSTADPLVLCVYANYVGHAVVPVAVNMDSQGNYILDVYDCNSPNQFNQLIIKKDFSGIQYGIYKTASFVKYSTIRDALTNADFTGKNLRKTKEESNKVSVAVNREDVKLVNGGGKDYTEIKGSYEQRRVSNDTEDKFSGVRSFVLPQGEYQMQDTSKKKEGDSQETEEDLKYYVATEDLFSAVETSDEDAKLTVKSVKGTGYDSVTLNSDKADTESELTVMSVMGLQKEISVKGSSVKAEIVDDKEMSIEVSDDTTEVKVDGEKVTLSKDNTADISFLASEKGNPLNATELSCDLSLDEKNQLSGTVEGCAMWASQKAGDVDITTVVKDDHGVVIAEYEKKMQMNLGMQKINISLNNVKTNLADMAGEFKAVCEMTISDSDHNEVKVSQSDIILNSTGSKPRPTPTATVTPTATATLTPTATPASTATPAPIVTSEPTATPTQTPITDPDKTARPTQTPTSDTHKTAAPTQDSGIKPTISGKPNQIVSDDKTKALPVKGTKVESGSLKYEVIKSDKVKGTVAVTGAKSKKAAKIVIPKTITVNNYTFKVTSIKENAFSNMKKLTDVTIGSNVTMIGSNAFKKCTKLKFIVIPKDVTAISAKAFAGCKKLKGIMIRSDKIKTIGSGAFKGTAAKATVKVSKKRRKKYVSLFIKKGKLSKKAKFIVSPAKLKYKGKVY